MSVTDRQINHQQIAILMTCHNRRDFTLSCLEALNEQKVNFKVYLVDDGSNDGTSEAVSSKYPEIKLIPGDGNLFWVGGMRLAFAEAIKDNCDYYLWLNDDTLLKPKAIENLLEISDRLEAKGDRDSIIVGSTQDPVTGKPTYGGAVRSKIWYSNKFEFLEPSNSLQQCDTMYGNCVLIPRSVVDKVGNLDPIFIHTMGDLDYGLRAKKLGCSIWAAPEFVGTCSKNSVKNSWVDIKLPLHKRLQKAFQIKGFPWKPWYTFAKRHSGMFWFVYLPLPYLRSIIGYKNLNASSTFGEDVRVENLQA
jgi:GT2 family glycosyltransferase